MKAAGGVVLILAGLVLVAMAFASYTGYVGKFVFLAGAVLVVTGIPLLTGKQLPSGPQHRCYGMGAALALSSLIILGRALWKGGLIALNLKISAGLFLLGIAFLFAGVMVARSRRQVRG